MKIKIVRWKKNNLRGTLYLGGEWFCETFEPCGQVPNGVYSIVKGAYLIDGHTRPMLKDVPTIGTASLQNGEKPLRSVGIIGIGCYAGEGEDLIYGQPCFSALCRLFEMEWSAGREVVVEIKDEE